MLEFGVSGKLIRNALVMFDRQSGSLWSQFLSRGVKGEYDGTRLEIVPVTLTTWEDWSKEHPDTVALRKTGRNTGDPYEFYYLNSDAGVIGESNSDDRLPTKALVLGMGFDQGPKAFPISELREIRVVNDTVAGEPVVIYHNDDSGFSLAYSREVDGDVLRFSLETHEGDEVLVDEQTGTRWKPTNGIAIEGEMRGAALERVHAVNLFWFAWTDFFPETELFSAEGTSTTENPT